MHNVYAFKVEKSNGEVASLEQFKGQPLLIVNTASKCKFTPQFDDLQKLYDQYHDQGLQVLGFPSNQFGGQEPGSNVEAASFCKINYGVSFPIFGKIDVNGPQSHPLFEYLKQQKPFSGFDELDIQAKLLRLMISEKNPEWLIGDAIKWNFTKFLIDADGQVIQRYEPHIEFSVIESDIKQLLEQNVSTL